MCVSECVCECVCVCVCARARARGVVVVITGTGYSLTYFFTQRDYSFYLDRLCCQSASISGLFLLLQVYSRCWTRCGARTALAGAVTATRSARNQSCPLTVSGSTPGHMTGTMTTRTCTTWTGPGGPQGSLQTRYVFLLSL